MWSDRAAPEVLRGFVASLGSAVPSSALPSTLIRTELRGSPTVEQVGQVSNAEPGFALLNSSWPDRDEPRPCVFRNPIASVTYWDGEAVVRGPNGTVKLAGQGFDILEAMLQVWQGSPAVLVGFLSYELAGEVEDLGDSQPRRDFHFPKFHFGLFDAALALEDNQWR